MWRTTRPCVLPIVTTTPTGGRSSGRDADRGARLRKIDHAASDVGAIRQNQPCHCIARREAAVAAVFRQIEDLPIGKPCQLRGKLVALAQRRRNGHGEAILEVRATLPSSRPR